MSLTLASAASRLLNGCRGQVVTILSLLGGATDDPAATAFLQWPMAEALGDCGIATATSGVVVDADFANLPADYERRFFVSALFSAKRALLGNLVGVDMQRGTDSQKLSQLAGQLEAEIAALKPSYDKFFPVAFSAAFGGGMTAVVDYGKGCYPPIVTPCHPGSPYPDSATQSPFGTLPPGM